MNPSLYQVIVRRSAQKDMRRIPRMILEHIIQCMIDLETNPFPSGVKPVSGYPHYFRIRIGQYRMIYEVKTQIRIITIMRIGHRRDVYRKI